MCAERFLIAVEAVAVDEMFEVQSEYTTAALKTALVLQTWSKHSPRHYVKLSSFAHILIVRLNACFPCKHSTLQLKKERMWGAYHRLRTSVTFVGDWQTFLSTSVQLKAFPAFYQFVTHYVFKGLIKLHYPVSVEAGQESHSRPLTHVEQNALRYVAGYVIRKLRGLETSSHKEKDNMILLLMECAGDELDEDRGTETWTNMIDRGGLWHINDQTYSLFGIIEEEIRK